MKEYKKKQLKRIRIALIQDSLKRTNYIVKNKIFKETGENFFFQPRIIPSDPELIKFHNNVIVTNDDILVANANPANCILVNLTKDIFKIIFNDIAITPFIIGVFVS